MLSIPASVFGQANRKIDEKKIAKLQSTVDDQKSVYRQSLQTARVDLILEIGKFIDYVETASGVAPDLRVAILKELRSAKASFENDSRFAPIPALQGVYRKFAIQISEKYWELMRNCDQLRNALPSGDSRIAAVDREIETLSDEYTRYDSLKPGSNWVGYRSDFKMPPRMEINPAKIGQIGMFRKVQDSPVKADFELKIEQRKGRHFTGLISMFDRSFQAHVEGTYDGVNLEMKMVKMKRGAERYFEYAGELVGVAGLLNMQGIKTNNAATAGMVQLTLK